MNRRPLLLTGPYLAMWLWLIVPLTLHGLLPFAALSEKHVSLHLGGWIEEIDKADSISTGWRILRADRAYEQCRYVQMNKHTTSLVLLPPKHQNCAFLRVNRHATGHVVRSISNVELIEDFRRNF